MKNFNYYDDDINMIYQSSPEESGEALYGLLESLSSYGCEYNEATKKINNQLAELGISSKEDLFDILSKIADMWTKASITGYKEEGY